MIEGTKGMIQGYRERMRTRSCGTCERHDACAVLFDPGRWERGGGRPFLRSLFGALGQAIAREVGRKRASPSVRRQVEREIEPLLASGSVRIDTVARALGCSRQTLYRRLKAEALTFEEVLDDLRRRRAVKLVRGSQSSVKDIAYRLGFSDPAAFSRAFKRWTGFSPLALREAKALQAAG